MKEYGATQSGSRSEYTSGSRSEYNKEYYKKNSEKCIAATQRYKAKNKERLKEYQKEYQKELKIKKMAETKEPQFCLNCSCEIFGRAGRKFCSDNCNHKYHYIPKKGGGHKEKKSKKQLDIETEPKYYGVVKSFLSNLKGIGAVECYKIADLYLLIGGYHMRWNELAVEVQVSNMLQMLYKYLNDYDLFCNQSTSSKSCFKK